MNKNSCGKLTVFSLVMITVVSVDSVRNLPASAIFGSQLIFFYLLGMLIFFVPSALVSADLSAKFKDSKGIYEWVKSAFGINWGFFAVWLQWAENVIWYPAILSFAASNIAYLIDPALATNHLFMSLTVPLIFWVMTLINLKGVIFSAKFSNYCSILGLILPMSIIIGLGILWLMSGQHISIDLHPYAWLPHKNSHMWVSLTAIILSFCGMEIATVHAIDVKNPQTAFPQALFWSTIIIGCTLIFGSLAIAVVLPSQKISFVAGIMQTMDIFLTHYHIRHLLPLMALMLTIGTLGSVSNWIIAPTRGLLFAARDEHLPTILCRTNSHNAPHILLISQAVIVTLISLVYYYLPNVNDAYWMMTAVASGLYMLMYILMFLSCIFLYKPRPNNLSKYFHIPGGKLGTYIVCIAGILGSVLTLAVSLSEPYNMNFNFNPSTYAFIIAALLLIFSLPPWVMALFKRKN